MSGVVEQKSNSYIVLLLQLGSTIIVHTDKMLECAAESYKVYIKLRVYYLRTVACVSLLCAETTIASVRPALQESGADTGFVKGGGGGLTISASGKKPHPL